MLISFDMQAFQSANRIGGIGKYNHDFLKTLFRLYPDNRYNLIYNGRNKHPEDTSFENFACSHPQTISYLPGNDLNLLNKWVNLSSLRFTSTDILHILSPFEDQRNTVIPNKWLHKNTVLTIYDFIPYIFRNLYLNSPLAEKQYLERAKILKSAALMLAISEATRQDAINLFDVPPEKIINIGIAPSDDYYKIDQSNIDVLKKIKKNFGINEKFVLTVSNTDHRKNLPALLQAFSSLPQTILDEFSLIVVTNSRPEYINSHPIIGKYVDQSARAKIKFLYSISNQDLCTLYNACSVFIYASLYEGGGLPVIEAMKCGAAVIASNSSSIPEFVGRTDNLFDPKNIDDIINSMEKILTKDSFRQEIQEHGLNFSKNLTWENVVTKAMQAYKTLDAE